MRGGWGGVSLPKISLFDEEKETDQMGGVVPQMGWVGQMGGWGEAINGI